MSKELYVGSLSLDVTEYDLEKLFSVSGRVTSIHLICDNKTGEFKGCGYVRMSSEAEAKDAIASLDGAMLIDRRITVSIANPQKIKSQGGYKGKSAAAPKAGVPAPRKSATGKPGAAKTAGPKPAGTKPAAAKPAAARPAAAKSAGAKPAEATSRFAKADAPKTGFAKTESRTGFSKPEARSGFSKPGASKTGAPKTGFSKPGASKTGGSRSGKR